MHTVDRSHIGALVDTAKVYIYLLNKQESLANVASELNVSRDSIAAATRQLNRHNLIEHAGYDIVCNSQGYTSLHLAYRSLNPIRASLRLVEKKFGLSTTHTYQ